MEAKRNKSKIAEEVAVSIFGIRHEYFYLGLIMFVYFCLEVFLGTKMFISVDESYTLNTTMHSLSEATRRSIVFEGQPPVYFALLNLWRELSDSIFFARLFSSIFTTMSILVVYFYVKKRHPLLNPLLVILLYSFNPILIWAGTEIRCFALVIFLAALLFYFFESLYVDNQRPLKWHFVFILIALVAVHTHYYFSFFLLANGVYLLLFHRQRVLRYALGMLIPALSLLLYISYVGKQIAMHETEAFQPTFMETFVYWMQLFKSYLLPIPHFAAAESTRFYLLIPVLALLLFVRFKLILSYIRHYLAYLATLFISMMIIYLILYFYSGTGPVAVRHTYFLYIPVIIFIITGLYFLKFKMLQYLMLALLLGIYGAHLMYNYPKFENETEVMEIHKTIQSDPNSHVPVLFYNGPTYFIYQCINQDTNIYSIPKPINLGEAIVPGSWAIQSKEQLDTLFNSLAYSDTLWLVLHKIYDLPDYCPNKQLNPRLNYPILENYIKEHYEVLFRKNYDPDYVLRKMVIKSQTAQTLMLP